MRALLDIGAKNTRITVEERKTVKTPVMGTSELWVPKYNGLRGKMVPVSSRDRIFMQKDSEIIEFRFFCTYRVIINVGSCRAIWNGAIYQIVGVIPSEGMIELDLKAWK